MSRREAEPQLVSSKFVESVKSEPKKHQLKDYEFDGEYSVADPEQSIGMAVS